MASRKFGLRDHVGRVSWLAQNDRRPVARHIALVGHIALMGQRAVPLEGQRAASQGQYALGAGLYASQAGLCEPQMPLQRAVKQHASPQSPWWGQHGTLWQAQQR